MYVLASCPLGPRGSLRLDWRLICFNYSSKYQLNPFFNDPPHPNKVPWAWSRKAVQEHYGPTDVFHCVFLDLRPLPFSSIREPKRPKFSLIRPKDFQNSAPCIWCSWTYFRLALMCHAIHAKVCFIRLCLLVMVQLYCCLELQYSCTPSDEHEFLVDFFFWHNYVIPWKEFKSTLSFKKKKKKSSLSQSFFHMTLALVMVLFN